jgi:TPR repeat protein
MHHARRILAAAAIVLAAPATAQSVQAGVEAWQQGRYDEAAAQWRPLAERGDADAAYNLGHAYRLGRGVPQDMATAERYYRQAAEAGHTEAQAMYGLLLFQNGQRQEAMPFIQRAAEHGDPRAQYVYGTALFNGDLAARDWPSAYAYMTRAAAAGLPYARTQLAEMERNISAEDQARGRAIAATLAGGGPTQVASASPPPPPPSVPTSAPPPQIATTQVPPSAPAAPRRETPPGRAAGACSSARSAPRPMRVGRGRRRAAACRASSPSSCAPAIS